MWPSLGVLDESARPKLLLLSRSMSMLRWERLVCWWGNGAIPVEHKEEIFGELHMLIKGLLPVHVSNPGEGLVEDGDGLFHVCKVRGSTRVNSQDSIYLPALVLIEQLGPEVEQGNRKVGLSMSIGLCVVERFPGRFG